MEFDIFLQKAQNLPVVDTRLLSAGLENSTSIKVQISRWVKSGKLIQLKRGLYLLAEPYRKVQASELYIACMLKNPSYVSLEKALEYHGLIPEAVCVYTCVTTKRPESIQTSVGIYDYQHIKPSFFWGYTSVTFDGQTFFMASAEKALLDLFYFRHVKVSLDYLEGLRLQNTEHIDLEKLSDYVDRFQKPGLKRAAELVKRYAEKDREGVKFL